MTNKAKCKLCGDIIESLHKNDLIKCSCGEIAIAGGEYELLSFANDYANFLRIDEFGEEKSVTYIENYKDIAIQEKDVETPFTRTQLIDMLDRLIKYYDKMPSHAQLQFVTHKDLSEALSLMLSIWRAED
jgi:hypothetical protein